MFGYVTFNVKYYILSQIFYKKNRVNRWEIQPYLTRSKWNTGEMFGLKFYYHICIVCSAYTTKIFLNPSMQEEGHFC